MSKRKTNVGGIIAGSIATVLLLGLIGGVAYKSEGFRNWNIKEWFNTSKSEETTEKTSEEGLETDAEGANVNLLSTYSNDDGSVTYVYGYEFNSNSVTRKGVTASLSFVDANVNDNVSNYLTVEVDNTNQTFSLTKSADFSHQIKLELVSTANSDVKATIKIDCVQKFLGFEAASSMSVNYDLDDGDFVAKDNLNDILTYMGAFNVSSTYSIAGNFTPSLDSWSLTLNGMKASNSQMTVSSIMNCNSDSFSDFNCDSTDADFNELEISKASLIAGVDQDSLSYSDAVINEIEATDIYGVDMTLTLNVSVGNNTKTFAVNIYAYTDVSDFTLGIEPTSIVPEAYEIVF